MSNPPPASHYPLGRPHYRNWALHHIRRYWRGQTLSGKVGTVLGAFIGVVLLTSFWKEALDGPEAFTRAVVQFVGVYLKMVIVNAGAIAEPLIAPMMNIAMFCWAAFSIALCFWLWGFCRRKFG